MQLLQGNTQDMDFACLYFIIIGDRRLFFLKIFVLSFHLFCSLDLDQNLDDIPSIFPRVSRNWGRGETFHQEPLSPWGLVIQILLTYEHRKKLFELCI